MSARNLCTIVLLALLMQIAAYGLFYLQVPPVPQIDRDLRGEALALEAQRIDREFVRELPLPAAVLAWQPAFSHDDYLRALVDPDEWTVANVEPLSRIIRFNSNLQRFHDKIAGAFVYLGFLHAVAFVALTVTLVWRRAVWLYAVALLAGCGVFSICTEAVLSADYGFDLIPYVLPQWIGAGTLLILYLRSPDKADSRGLGWLLLRYPTLLAFLLAGAFLAAGAGLIAIGADENMAILVTAGATFIANGLVLLGVVVWSAGSWLLGKLRG